MTSTAAAAAPMAKVSCITATAIVVADMVGVGVFTSLGFQVQNITSGFTLLLLWVVGGIAAMCGALCYAELAAMFPRSSGEYNFLSRIYHPSIGFMAGWISATVGFAAPLALAAMAFGAYFKAIAPDAPPLVSGLAVLWLVSLVHLCGIRYGSSFQNIWTALKLLLIVAFLVAGFAFGIREPITFSPGMADIPFIASAPFAISLVFVMYSYSGWNAATYIIDEVSDPARNLPRALCIGTLIVSLLYVGLNAVFLITTPISAMAGQLDVAIIAGNHIFGPFGGRLVGAIISLGLVSSISAMVWIGPRVITTMGEDLAPLRFFSRHSGNGAPVRAIMFQLLVSNVLLLTQSFEEVLDFIQFSYAFCSFLTVLGVIYLRITRPELSRPYRAWGYPATPAVFLAAMVLIMAYLIIERPLQSLASAAMLAAGILIFKMFLSPLQASPLGPSKAVS